MQIINLNKENLNKFFSLFETILSEDFPEYSSKIISHFLTKDYSKLSFDFNIDRPYRKVLLALEDEMVVGYIVADQTYGGVGFVSFFGVHKDYRKRGIGKALISEYENFCHERKAHMIRLYTFKRIMSYYEKLGFEKIGEEKQGYWGTDNQIMAKMIGKWNEETLDF